MLTVLLRRQAKELRLQETSGKPLMKWLHLDGTVIYSFFKKVTLHFIRVSMYIYSTKVLIGDSILASLTGDGTRCFMWSSHSHEGLSVLQGLYFSVILRP